MSKPLVAIVGRPNVGKSTLFNKLVGRRISIVHDTPGVTRDRIYAECEWRSRTFDMVDTGGIEQNTHDAILVEMRTQAQMAIDMADVTVMVVDIKTGLTADDEAVANMLLKSGKPVILCVNKVDQIGTVPADFYEFYNLGLGDPYALSALHGNGTGELLDAVFEHFPKEEERENEDPAIKVAIIGKPNAGKSSLINSVLREERSIVSSIPGTTRDSVDARLKNEFGEFIFIDTAGIRRKSKINESVEHYSVLRAQMAVERADVCLIMIDGDEGFTEQDAKIAGLAHDEGKASIIIVNKWDIVEKETGTLESYTKDIRNGLSFMTYAPILFISAKTGQRVSKLFPLILNVNEQHKKRVSTGILNDVLNEAMAKVQPPSDKGKRLKIYYMTQASATPPSFVYFCNRSDLFHFSYQRYLENQIRQVFGFEGTPLRFTLRQRGEKEDNL